VALSNAKNLYRLNGLRCTNSTDFNMKGDYSSPEFQYVQFNAYPCEGKPECKPKKEIENYMN